MSWNGCPVCHEKNERQAIEECVDAMSALSLDACNVFDVWKNEPRKFDVKMCVRHRDFLNARMSIGKEYFEKEGSCFEFLDCLVPFEIGPIEKRKFKNVVFNHAKEDIREDFEKLLKLHNVHLEFIHEAFKTGEKGLVFITNFFVAKLSDVWENKFPVDNVEKVFFDLFSGLMYLRSKRICHGSIHDRNIAWDGEHWYISGLVGLNMVEESTCVQPPRCLSFFTNGFPSCSLRKFLVPADDLWQLIFMFLLTKFQLYDLEWLGRFSCSNVIVWNKDAEKKSHFELFKELKSLLFAGIHPSEVDDFSDSSELDENERLGFNSEEYNDNYVKFENILKRTLMF